jgi:hypothetical protein
MRESMEIYPRTAGVVHRDSGHDGCRGRQDHEMGCRGVGMNDKDIAGASNNAVDFDLVIRGQYVGLKAEGASPFSGTRCEDALAGSRKRLLSLKSLCRNASASTAIIYTPPGGVLV